ncbi:hypothetical protein GCM10025867_47210 (plasmid) [Frondihabitans sucicola]|uniref:Sigma-like protein n=1 Tax=Frondihabitans sucicola TaxID=1268041 RepID=A0ABN6Y579_9MICO|nr:hypothetical protein GCM10025867_47210 [Frondihabitans sucicola]
MTSGDASKGTGSGSKASTTPGVIVDPDMTTPDAGDSQVPVTPPTKSAEPSPSATYDLHNGKGATG